MEGGMLVANESGFCLETTSRVEVWEVLNSGIIFFSPFLQTGLIYILVIKFKTHKKT